MSDAANRHKMYCKQIEGYFRSPFRQDQRFILEFLAETTRDKMSQHEEVIDKLFYDGIYKIIVIPGRDERDVLLSYDILANMISSKKQRAKLAKNGYLKNIYAILNQIMDEQFMQSPPIVKSPSSGNNLTLGKQNSQEEQEMGTPQFQTITTDYSPAPVGRKKATKRENERLIEKLSYISTLICFHEKDLTQTILDIDLIGFLINICNPSLSITIRKNAILSMNMLCYNQTFLDQLIKRDCLDIIISLAMDPDQNLYIIQAVTQALVQFALNKSCINILIEKRVIDLFQIFRNLNDMTIQINVSWIFLALCINGIESKEMLKTGITRDMFLIACKPTYETIRQLVITSFAVLGKNIDIIDSIQSHQVQKIKELSISAISKHIKLDSKSNIKILLNLSASKNDRFKFLALWCIKDHLLLSSDHHEEAEEFLEQIYASLISGCTSSSHQIQQVCVKAISFLLSQRKIYKDLPIEHKFFEERQKSQRIKDDIKKMPDLEKVVDLGVKLSLIEAKAKSIEKQLDKELIDIEIEDPKFYLDAIMILSGSDDETIKSTAFSTLSTISELSSSTQSVMTQVLRDIQYRGKNYYQFITERLQGQKIKFEESFQDVLVEKSCTGFYSLLALAHDPLEEEIRAATLNFKSYVHSREPPPDLSKGKFTQQQIDHINHIQYQQEQNEIFFIDVFAALKHCDHPDVLIELAGITNHYCFNNDLANQKEFINSSNILWLLTIIDKNLTNRYLSAIFSLTLLGIVENHNVTINYQEQEIIRKFNSILTNIDGDSDDEEPVTIKDSIIEESEENNSVSSVSKSLSHNSARRLENAQMLNIEKREKFKKKTSSNSVMNILKTRGSNKELKLQVINKKDDRAQSQRDILKFNREIQMSQKTRSQKSIAKITKKSTLFFRKNCVIIPDSGDKKQKEAKTYRKMQTLFKTKPNQDSEVLEGSLSQINESEDTSFKSDTSFENSIAPPQSDEENMIADTNGLVKSLLAHDHDEDLVETYLRDSIIKAFMIIFTNEKSQHLLQNQDLIEIAFSCLKSSQDITIEAQKNVTRLTSMIVIFPDVQEQILEQQDIIEGLINLINELAQGPKNEKTEQILQFLIQISNTLSKNLNLIQNREVSQMMLQAQMNLLKNQDLFTKSQNIMILQGIDNIVQGSLKNCLNFVLFKGYEQIIQMLLDGSEEYEIWNICLSILCQCSNDSSIFQKVQSESLVQAISLSLERSQDWPVNKVRLTYDILISQEDIQNEDVSSVSSEEEIKNKIQQRLQSKIKLILKQEKQNQKQKDLKFKENLDLIQSAHNHTMGQMLMRQQAYHLLGNQVPDADMIQLLLIDLQRLTQNNKNQESQIIINSKIGITIPQVPTEYGVEYKEKNEQIFAKILAILKNLVGNHKALQNIFGQMLHLEKIIENMQTQTLEKKISLVHVYGGLILEKTYDHPIRDDLPQLLQKIHGLLDENHVLTDAIFFITEIILSQIWVEHPKQTFDKFLQILVTDNMLLRLSDFLDFEPLLCLKLFNHIFKVEIFASQTKKIVLKPKPLKRHISFGEEIKQVFSFSQVNLREISFKIQNIIPENMAIEKEIFEIVNTLNSQDFDQLLSTVLDTNYILLKDFENSSDSEEENHNSNVCMAVKSILKITDEIMEKQTFENLEQIIEKGLIVICHKMVSLFKLDESFMTSQKECHVKMLEFDTESIKLARDISCIILNLSKICFSNSTLCLTIMEKLIFQLNFINLIKSQNDLLDYEIQEKNIETIYNILSLSKKDSNSKKIIQEKAIKEGLLTILINNLQNEEWLHVKRLSNFYISQLQISDLHLFDLQQLII